MPDDQPTTKPDEPKDEALALSCAAGDNSAFDILFHRYKVIVRLFFLGKSWFKKDPQYIDDLVEQAFIVVWQCLKAGKFKLQGVASGEPRPDLSPEQVGREGSFRNWLFGLCQLECYKQDSKRAKWPIVTSAIFPASFSDIPVKARTQPNTEDELLRQAEINAKFNKVVSKLEKNEPYLMQLVGEGMKYKDIIKKPEFSNYSVAGIKQKIYNIRKRFK